MLNTTLSSLVAKRLATLSSGSWTCARCRSAQTILRGSANTTTRSPLITRRYASNTTDGSSSWGKSGGGQGSKQRPRNRRVLLATTGGAAGITAGLLSVGDDVKNGYGAAERTGRVAAALALCVNDYRTTLNKRDKLGDPEEKEAILKACHQRCADRTLKVLEKNGGIFIKLGQHLSAMNYLLPPEWTKTFIPLQDRCPISSLESIQAMFKSDTGQDLSDYFSYFSPEPIGAASLAQVHLATIRETGQNVAVKVQHPSLQQWSKLDMTLTSFTFSTLKRFFPEYDLEWLSSEVEVSLPQELDFQCEAENSLRTKSYFSRLPDIPLVIPDVIWAKKRILVMACEAGKRLDDLSYMDSEKIDRDEVSATLAKIFNEMIFGDNAPLHCDPHGGNIAIRKNPSRRRGPNFDIILYDHGLYRDIPQSLRRSYAKMWLAVIDGDMEGMKKYVNEVAGIGEDKFPLFASAITGRDFSIVSKDITKPKEASEQKTMSTALQEGLLVDLVQMLGQVPRIILLILKTNDLTRSLDESLHTTLGPVRNFLILARYCMRTVFHEQLEEIRAKGGSLLWPGNAIRVFAAWLGYMRVEFKVEAFELWLSIRRMLGFRNIDMGGAPGLVA
ncbi:ABC1 family-domain-containing protein [Podospora australis]|uniref:ABC1 family-domain-containing protein n=1 Tax=Podospora australis TaxID=1536484 RepID=A0AAN7ALV0_9PEZI|nr:ABC1 family-domain-containing protein [Podospora australis]